jgi:hypothetical protein
MSAPTLSEYDIAASASYTSPQSGDPPIPSASSPAVKQRDGLSALALKDPCGNIIISQNNLPPAANYLSLKSRAVDLAAERRGQTPLPALRLDRSDPYFNLARLSEDSDALIHQGSATRQAVIAQSEVTRRSEAPDVVKGAF